MKRAAVTAMIAATLAAGAVEGAPAAVSPLALPGPGFCVPAPDDATYVPRTVKAVGVAGGATKPIAILDTGVDPTTPQLAGRVLQGYDAATGAPVADDPDGHGTEAASLAAAAGPGVQGVSPGSPILPIRIYDAQRASSVDVLVKGIALAVAKGAGVIVIGGAGPLASVSDDDVRKVTTAIDAAFARGVLTVAGSGDDGGSAPMLPAGLPHVLVAGSATATQTRSAQTDTGPWLDLLAPAEGVEAALPPALCAFGFAFSGGTSFAGPSLGGAAALVLAHRPTLTTQQAFELLRRSGADIGVSGRDDDSGYGMLDVSAALSATALAKESGAEVDDDPHWLRGTYARAHPALLTATKLRFKVRGTVSPAKDPADVYAVKLAKRERIVASVTADDPNALLELSILSPGAGDFDVTDGVDDTRLVATGGLSSDPQLELRASRAGTYFVAVQAADAVDASDPTAAVADLVPYRLSAYKQRPSAKRR
ncbi:MAG: hypothetical protein QOF26_1068 [Baekduia sp.]|jgi:hypothetical protein|nr:hypothetical protein [Baekduia sp.]